MTKKNAATPTEAQRSMAMWARLEGGRRKNGSATSCTHVEAALKMRESSVETRSISMRSAKSAATPGGRMRRSVAGRIIWP